MVYLLFTKIYMLPWAMGDRFASYYVAINELSIKMASMSILTWIRILLLSVITAEVIHAGSAGESKFCNPELKVMARDYHIDKKLTKGSQHVLFSCVVKEPPALLYKISFYYQQCSGGKSNTTFWDFDLEHFKALRYHFGYDCYERELLEAVIEQYKDTLDYEFYSIAPYSRKKDERLAAALAVSTPNLLNDVVCPVQHSDVVIPDVVISVNGGESEIKNITMVVEIVPAMDGSVGHLHIQNAHGPSTLPIVWRLVDTLILIVNVIVDQLTLATAGKPIILDCHENNIFYQISSDNRTTFAIGDMGRSFSRHRAMYFDENLRHKMHTSSMYKEAANKLFAHAIYNLTDDNRIRTIIRKVLCHHNQLVDIETLTSADFFLNVRNYLFKTIREVLRDDDLLKELKLSLGNVFQSGFSDFHDEFEALKLKVATMDKELMKCQIDNFFISEQLIQVRKNHMELSLNLMELSLAVHDLKELVATLSNTINTTIRGREEL